MTESPPTPSIPRRLKLFGLAVLALLVLVHVVLHGHGPWHGGSADGGAGHAPADGRTR